jgi:hypothetical protein
VNDVEVLISDIVSYLEYINSNCGISVSVHFKNEFLFVFPKEAMNRLMHYNSHRNPYCLAVKKCNHKKCISEQKSIIKEQARTIDDAASSTDLVKASERGNSGEGEILSQGVALPFAKKRMITPTVTAEISCAKNIAAPFAIFPPIACPMPQMIKAAPALLQKGKSRSPSSFDIRPARYSFTVRSAPSGYPAIMPITKAAPPSPLTPNSLRDILSKACPKYRVKPVFKANELTAAMGKRAGTTLFAHIKRELYTLFDTSALFDRMKTNKMGKRKYSALFFVEKCFLGTDILTVIAPPSFRNIQCIYMNSK